MNYESRASRNKPVDVNKKKTRTTIESRVESWRRNSPNRV